MNQINFRGEAGQKKRFFGCRIAATNHTDWNIFVEGAVASRARCQTVADQLLFIFKPEITCGCAAGDDERLCLKPFVVGSDPHVAVARLEIGHFRIRKSGAEFLCLVVHFDDEFRAINPVGKAGIILDQSRGRKLTARLAAFQNERA